MTWPHVSRMGGFPSETYKFFNNYCQEFTAAERIQPVHTISILMLKIQVRMDQNSICED
jgi:hypothetical protein